MNFNDLLVPFNIKLTDTQLAQFEAYFNFLIEYNQKVNLTAITDEEDVYIKHFLDSLLLSKSVELKDGLTLLDVGSGAGFPSIPLKILNPSIDVTIVDALDKRLKFLNELSIKLGFKVNLIHARAEDYANDARESFDIVTARAVARESIINELCLPLTKIGGIFVSMKGKAALEELSEGKSLEILNGKIEKIDEYILPKEDAKRYIIQIRHFKEAPSKYPRRFDLIKKKPL